MRLHTPRPNVGGGGVGVLGADGEAGSGVRPASANGRDRLWLRGRRLSHRPADAKWQRRVGLSPACEHLETQPSPGPVMWECHPSVSLVPAELTIDVVLHGRSPPGAGSPH